MATYAEQVAGQVRAEISRKRRAHKDVAAAAGLTPYYLSKRMAGHKAFSVADLDAIAGALGVPVSTLVNPAVTP